MPNSFSYDNILLVAEQKSRQTNQKLRLRGQAVKTSPFHGGNTGSIPVGVTEYKIFVMYADVAQLAEQLICNQQVIGSSPIIGLHQTVNLNDVCWKTVKLHMGGFPSGQRGQTVNLLQLASMVRIHLCPLKNLKSYDLRFLCYSEIII